MYLVTEYQYQQLKNYYPNCDVILEIGRQPQKELTDSKQLKVKIAVLATRLDFVMETLNNSSADDIIKEMQQLLIV